MTAEQSFQFVNEFLSIMGPVVRKNGGFIDKYIGDAIMALFDDMDDAVRAGVEMSAVLAEYNEHREESGRKAIDIGIGINKGLLRLGTVGETDRMNGTVISDAVNLASRVENLTLRYGVRCLITDKAYRGLKDPEAYCIQLIGHVRVKGKEKAITIYEVFDGDRPEIRKQKLRNKRSFEKAIGLFQLGEFERAKAMFQACLNDRPEDKTAAIYLSTCEADANS